MELAENWQGTRKVDHLNAELLYPKIWPKLSEFILRLTASWSRDPVTAPNTLCHNIANLVNRLSLVPYTMVVAKSAPIL